MICEGAGEKIKNKKSAAHSKMLQVCLKEIYPSQKLSLKKNFKNKKCVGCGEKKKKIVAAREKKKISCFQLTLYVVF